MFGNVPETWDRTTLEVHVEDLRAGVSVNSENRVLAGGEIGVLKTSCLSGCLFNPEQHKVVIDSDRDRVAVNPKADTIVISRMNTANLVGESAYIPITRTDLFLPDRLWRLDLKEPRTLDARWLSYVLASDAARSYIKTVATGTSGSMKNVSKESLLGFPLLMPPLPEQRKIAAILSSVDEAIQTTQAVIEQTRRVKEGLLQDLLTKGIGHTEFKQTEIGEIPEEWEVRGLGDLVQPGNGLQTGPFGSQLHASDYTDFGVPVVMPKDIVDGAIDSRTIARVPESIASSKLLQKHRLHTGDIVFGRRGDIGRCGLVGIEHEGWLCGTGCLRARPHDGVFPEYLIHRLRHSDAIGWLNDNAVGQTMLNLNTTILGNLPLSLPPFPEQREIAAILSAVDEPITNGLECASQLYFLKSGLLQDLLTGKVRVSI